MRATTPSAVKAKPKHMTNTLAQPIATWLLDRRLLHVCNRRSLFQAHRCRLMLR